MVLAAGGRAPNAPINSNLKHEPNLHHENYCFNISSNIRSWVSVGL